MSALTTLYAMAKMVTPGSVRNRLRPMLKSPAVRGRIKRCLMPWRPRWKQVFVCGYPRGGTSLLYNMLSASVEGFEFADFEASALETIKQRGSHASKLPMDVYNVSRIAQANIHDKDVLCIIVIRDPRDIVTSIHPNVPNEYFCSYEWRWSPRGEHPYTLVKDDRGIRSIHEAISRAEEVEGLKLMFVKYEDIVDDPDAVQRRIGSLLQLNYSRRFSEFATVPERHAYRYAGSHRPVDATQVRENQPVDRSRHGKWRRPEHRERIRLEFSAHPELFSLLKEYGYEKDDGWFEAFEAEGDRVVSQ